MYGRAPWRGTVCCAHVQGVWPPSDWDPRLAERSSQLPDTTLALDYVHGYDG